MKKPFANPAEQRCSACDGTGFPAVKQPAQPSLRIYTARCKACAGKGRIWKADAPELKKRWPLRGSEIGAAAFL